MRELGEYGITPVVCDPVADRDEAGALYGIRLSDLSEVKGADAVIICVAHDEFKALTPETVDSFYGKGKRVLLDIKGIFDRHFYEDRGYLYWRL